ncbi:MAG: outer membrane beta-barrel protein [Terracidiphilus sp.]
MRFKWFIPPILAVGLFAAAVPVFSQVVPSYYARGIPVSVGVGPSIWDVDWGRGHMLGGTGWVDWYPGRVQSFVHGLGIEFEVRDVHLNRGYGQMNIRQDTAGGGPIYTPHVRGRFHPYAKFLVAQGSMDFTSPSPTYSHDTRMLIAPGGGLEYRFAGPFKVRVDYEYQVWIGKLLGNTPTPSGFTFGFAYDLSHPQGR